MATALVLAACFASPQTPKAPLQFDVVSIKPDLLGDPTIICIPPDGLKCRRTGRWQLSDSPVSLVIREAYGAEIEGAPAWVYHTHYTFDLEVNPSVTDDEFRQMLQAMLADRFQLKAHLRAKPGMAVPLRIAPGGAKLKPASGNCAEVELIQPNRPIPCGGVVQTPAQQEWRGGWLSVAGRSVTMDDFATWLGSSYPGIVSLSEEASAVNETGLQGRFDVDFKFYVSPPEGHDPTDYTQNIEDAERSLKTALRRIGLLYDPFHPVKRPLPALVIESISPPTPN